MSAPLSDVDPFDLPDWLGQGEVTWEAEGGLRSGHIVPGRLEGATDRLPCDLLGIDEAYPAPVAPDGVRSRAHQAWRHGEILLLEREARLTLAVPARGFDADLVLDALGRLARAVGASPDRYAARLRLGDARR